MSSIRFVAQVNHWFLEKNLRIPAGDGKQEIVETSIDTMDGNLL